MLDYANSRWVKLYQADTVDWNRVGHEARCLLLLLWRKFDVAGGVEVDANPEEQIADLAELLRAPADFVQDGLARLLARGMLVRRELPSGKVRLEDPTFVEAQKARSSSAQRSRDHRERAAAQPEETRGDAVQRAATRGDAAQPAGTQRNAPQRDGTIRVEKKREEEKRSPPTPQGVGVEKSATVSQPAGQEASPPPAPSPEVAGGTQPAASPHPAATAADDAPPMAPGSGPPPTPLSSIEAIKILKAAAGERLVLHKPGHPHAGATGTGMTQAHEMEWTRVWSGLRGPWGADDLRALGQGIAERRIWGFKQNVTVYHLLAHLEAGLQEASIPPAPPPAAPRAAAAPARDLARPAGPSDFVPRGKPCGVHWCDGLAHYSEDPDLCRNPTVSNCPNGPRATKAARAAR